MPGLQEIAFIIGLIWLAEMAQIKRNWHTKYQIDESSGERKKNPSANLVKVLYGLNA